MCKVYSAKKALLAHIEKCENKSKLHAYDQVAEDGCLCQGCGKKYRVDLLIPDDLWNSIRPKGKDEGAGMLCVSCIGRRLEDQGRFFALHATSLPSPDYQRGQEGIAQAIDRLKEVMARDGGPAWHEAKRLLSSDLNLILHGLVNAYLLNPIAAADKAIRALPAQQESVCEWGVHPNGNSETYLTGCGNIHSFMSNADCPYCGRPIRLGGGE